MTPTPESAQKLSLPTQVALRRSQGKKTPDQDRARYDQLRATGKLLELYGEVPTYEHWLERTTRRRRRVRGTRAVTVQTPDGTSRETEVVGQKIYLPNLVFRLMRNHTPPGEPYNPYEATFRVPRAVTKNDIRGYLDAVYGVKTTYIRTDNYIAPLKRTLVDHHKVLETRSGGIETTYKRAVVGLVDPFVYPDAVEDMTAEEREKHEEWLENMFQVKTYRKYQQEKRFDVETNRVVRRVSTNRGRILELVMEKRKQREQAIREKAAELVASGASPFVSSKEATSS